MDIITEKLNQIKRDKEQYDAYQAENSTVLIAGPGSGKTTVLTLKLIRLLEYQIIKPRGLACLTYNKAAVNEFTTRLKDIKFKKRINVFLGTVHSFCMSEVITPFAGLYEYDIPLPLRIISETERKALFQEIVNDLDVGDANLKIGDVDKERTLQIRGLSSIPVETYDVALKVAIEFEKRLLTLQKVDFTAIVKYATLLIQEKSYVRRCLEAKFPWILVDEYQDLGKPLHEMMLSLHQMTNIKIFAVGDPDQSIYSFNGATPDYLLELANRPDINEIRLTTNYRSNQEVIDASLLGLDNGDRNYTAGTRKNEKAIFEFLECEKDMADQYQKVVEEIIPACTEQGVPLDEICVLVGKNDEIVELADAMEQANIPYYFAKPEYERSDFVIWLENCAKWVSNGNSQSFTNLFDFWHGFLRRHNRLLLKQNTLHERKQLYMVLNDSKKLSRDFGAWLNEILRKLDIIPMLKESEIYPDEFENLKKLIGVVLNGVLTGANVEKFSIMNRPRNQVTLSTRHSSKGLEFEVIILLGMEEGNFPHYKSQGHPEKLDEEKRVFFVCLSRAKRVCYLLRSKKITVYSKKYERHFEINKEPSMFWQALYEKYRNQTR
ncbi:DNA helicase [Siminovitchia terrae]|uniref:DNA 3'-5' helicase n=1 Tax=Siminovitchia terrae TaxID=1914933 RepID=A0ABQ4L4X6_SIMTE|nr:ATP-dependent helicase [Siminovitchia terrae]GIN98940.1 DNA helicase [Siminovitchia terrae]